MHVTQRIGVAFLAASTLAIAACSGGHTPLPPGTAGTQTHARLTDAVASSPGLRLVADLKLTVQGTTAQFAISGNTHCDQNSIPFDAEGGRDAYVGNGEKLSVPGFTVPDPCTLPNGRERDGSTTHRYYVLVQTLPQDDRFAIAGQGAIGAGTLRMPASNAPLVLSAQQKYAFYLVDAAGVLATPTPPPSAWCPSDANLAPSAPAPLAAPAGTQTQSPNGMLTYAANTTSIHGGQRIICGPNGDLFVASRSGVKRFTPSLGSFAAVYAQTIVPGAGIAADAAGKLYVAQYTGKGSAAIVQMASDGSGVTQTAIPFSYVGSLSTFGLTEGNDGNVYAAAYDSSNAASVLQVGAQVSAYAMPSSCSSNASLFAGTDGDLWVSATCGWSKMSVPGTFTIVAPAAQPLAYARLGPDGKLYAAGQSALLQFDPATGATVSFPLPAEAANPQTPAAGSDGKLWFSATDASSSNPILCRLDVVSGTLTEYPLGSITGGAVFADMTPAADGNLYAIAGDGILKIAPSLAGK